MTRLAPLALALVLVTSRAAAGGSDERSVQARAAFVDGISLVQKSQWAEAIAAFELADRIAPHAIATYNLGACERAIGHFTIAHGHFVRALAQHAASGLSDPLE
jgi:tetratricopeptide (TPR) repeat protein